MHGISDEKHPVWYWASIWMCIQEHMHFQPHVSLSQNKQTNLKIPKGLTISEAILFLYMHALTDENMDLFP